MYTVIHELGHVIDKASGGRGSGSQQYQEAIGNHPPPSDYGAQNPGEDFAESFLWLVVNHDTGSTAFEYYEKQVRDPGDERRQVIQCHTLGSVTSPNCSGAS
jgi:hypothetical protein